MTKFKNILVHVDTDAESQAALASAAKLAHRDQAGLTIVCVKPELKWHTRLLLRGYAQIIEDISHARTRALKQLAEPLVEQGLTVETKIIDGPPTLGILWEVERHHHDLVVQASDGRKHKFFGAIATRLLRKCPCPVLILNTDREFRGDRVLAAVTSSGDEVHQQLNNKILELATQMSNGKPEVISAWQAYGEHELEGHMTPEEFALLEGRTKSLAEEQLEAVLRPFGMKLTDDNVDLVHADAGNLIPHVARERDIDLLVMGSVGRKGIAGFLIGNIAEQILDEVRCSVLAIKPTGFSTDAKTGSGAKH